MQRTLAIAIWALAAVGAAHAQTGDARDAVNDPFEPFNRAMFRVNDVLDRAALEPAAKGYRAVTPKFFRTGVSNFLGNLRAPVVLANDILQVEPKRAGATATRFAINTTVGLAGLIDVAERMGIEGHGEDFGQTLGKWGVGAGPYLFLPFFGPSSLRDAAGRGVDAAINPMSYAKFDGDDAFRISTAALGAVNGRAGAIETIENLRATSIDPYVSVRSSFTLLRESAIRNGRSDVQDLPEFEDVPSVPDQTGATQ